MEGLKLWILNSFDCLDELCFVISNSSIDNPCRCTDNSNSSFKSLLKSNPSFQIKFSHPSPILGFCRCLRSWIYKLRKGFGWLTSLLTHSTLLHSSCPCRKCLGFFSFVQCYFCLSLVIFINKLGYITNLSMCLHPWVQWFLF